MAQQRSHVPKFGNWDGENNIPYTAYFENARKEKSSGVRMNPNDPEENPEAFMFGRVGLGSDGVSQAVGSPARVNSNKSISAEKHQTNGLKQHNGHRRNTYDQQKSGSYKSMTSESSSDKSSSDYSIMQQNHHRTRSIQKKSMTDVYNFIPSSPGPDRLRSPNNPSDDISHRSASVPKFGEWDEKDPKSGEGFTVIFNKVKEEKHTAAAKFPTVPPQPSNYTNKQKQNTKSKICCCLFSSGSD